MTGQIHDKVTIVVPCYNVEKYLAKCLDSLLAQTYKNLEIIMVEDCSTDNTRDIVLAYESKHDNIRAIYNEKNGGLGNARNVGIEAVDSEYLGFLDSDDWLPENFVQEMYNTLIEADADLSICDVFLRYDDPSKDQRIVSYSGKPDKYGLINASLAATSSAKLFKTALFDNLKYPVAMVNEDIPVTLAILSKSKVAYTDKTHFSYYQRTGSIQNSKITSRRLDIFKALALLQKNVDGKIDEKLWQAIVWHQVFAVFLYVFPRAKGVFTRRKLIEQFYCVAEESSVEIGFDNPGFIAFLENNKIDRLYGPRVVKSLNSKRFFKASVLMGVYSFVQNNIGLVRRSIWLARKLKFAVLHPIRFSKKVIDRTGQRVKSEYVIDNSVGMDDLILASKRQGDLSGDGIISVVIPNYNYERYMFQRIYSILYQTQKIGEIIILDDNSTDDSVKLAEEVQSNIGGFVNVRLINNKVNQGTFSQWELGFKEAKFDYVWIAEADDYCSNIFLESALRPMREDSEVVISYVNTGYANGEGLLLGDVKRDIDYQETGHWDQSYINDGMDEAKTYSYVNNTIANVSSVVFKKDSSIDYATLFVDARKYRQAGDWVFYVNYMMYGKVAYTDIVANYYRMHGDNVSSTTKAQDHINEILDIQKRFTEKLNLDEVQISKMASRIKLLEEAWNL